MSTRSRARGAASWRALAALAALLGGCYGGGTGKPEECNHLDDDLDGVADDEFVDDDGIYYTAEHCGDCNIECQAVFPSAAEVACVVSGDAARCEIVSCPPGTHLIGNSLCTPDTPMLCLPCVADADCAQADPTARCITLPGGDRRCGAACEGAADCPDGFECQNHDGAQQCAPSSGHCACTPEQEGQLFGCWIASPNESELCPGQQVCEGEELTGCAVLHEEVCDGADDDCDGATDEDFIVDGLYLTDDHCGACNHPCVAPASNMQSLCVEVDDAPTCEVSCLDGYVDLDAVLLNGCECEMTAAVWPPGAHGVDGDCDGTIDDMSAYIYVAKDGDDDNPGTLAEPVLTIGRGIELAAPGGKTVFVSQGTYDETVTLAAGVSLFGGYRSDFGDRDRLLFPTTIEHASGPAGHPTLVAQGIDVATEFGGFNVVGSDATSPGAGSTTVLLTDCGPELRLSDLKVVAGRGADGTDGTSSAAILYDLGVLFLSMLDGVSGSNGQGGFGAGTIYCSGLSGDGGDGGAKVCPVSDADVSGGDGGNASCPATGCVVGNPCGNAGCTDFMVGDTCDFDAVYDAAVPNPPAGDGQGTGGGDGGALTYDAPTTIAGSSFCDDNPTLRREGGDGGDGDDGDDGLGGDGYTDPNGAFDAATGIWTAGDGTDGTDGTDGSGGGGGTQGNGYDSLPGVGSPYNDQLGGAGGGGGSGGCGTPGANGGEGGGGSIGVAIILDAANQGPEIFDVRVVPAPAGKGGDGGIGASGGAPGPGGLGGSGNFWCARDGGRGGDGGVGGHGGGGGGGGGGSVSGFHIVPDADAAGDPAIYAAAIALSNDVDALPAPASAGAGGFSPGDSGTAGLNGTAATVRLFEPL